MPSASRGELFGHPKGLYVLFFTEMWERFSFYGMKTLLVLYMINHFFWSQERASSLLGTYAFFAYGLPIVGGFIADRWLGAKRAVVVGGILLCIGHFLMAFEPLPFFYSGLVFIIAGVGLLKPNVSTQVGSLYKPDDPRRDGAFTVFYMGINLGALIGPLLCGWLRVNYGYHYGFAAAGVGMFFGLIVYVIGQRKLVEFRQDVGDSDLDQVGKPTSGHPPHVVRDRVIVLLVVFAFVILFWTAFEQSPNAMLVWADKHTNLSLLSAEPSALSTEGLAIDVPAAVDAGSGTARLEMTAEATQSFNPFFIIALAPVFAWFWIWLDRRRLQPSTPTKMVLGLVLVAAAFGVMWPAAYRENRPSTAPLAAVPEGLAVNEKGQLYCLEEPGGDPSARVYFGATRLRYDQDRDALVMTGVLPDLDRLRMLSESASTDFREALDTIIERSSELTGDEVFSEVLLNAPADLASVGIEAKKVLAWDSATKTLTVKGEIKKRAQVEFLAMAAEPAFKKAVDRIYLDSSRFRVSVWWLILFFMVLTMGELCLSPVGLSLVTKLAPPKNVGLYMGGWFLATAVAEKAAQVFGAYWGKMPPAQYFFIFVVMCGVGAFFMALLVRSLKRRMHGVH